MRKFILFIFTKKFWANIGVFLVLFVIGIWALFSYLDKRTLHGEEIKVPLLIGYHISEIKNLLEKDRLNFKVMDSIYVENRPGGMVVEQNPDSGLMVKDGRKIYVTLSSYSTPTIPVPPLKDAQKRNVISQIKSMGFKVGEIRYIPFNCEDCLMYFEKDSVKLEPGTRLDIGSKLDLVLGRNSDEFIPVPNLIEKPLIGLEEVVLNKGLTISTCISDEEFSAEDSIRAFVYKQKPAVGEDNVPLGSAITFFLTTDYNKLPKQELIDSTQNNNDGMDN